MPRNGTTEGRGYGRAHRDLRDALLPYAYGKPCPKCGTTMHPPTHPAYRPLDLGHTEDRKGYTGIEHADCNRSAGATLGNRRRGRRNVRSRDW